MKEVVEIDDTTRICERWFVDDRNDDKMAGRSASIARQGMVLSEEALRRRSMYSLHDVVERRTIAGQGKTPTPDAAEFYRS